MGYCSSCANQMPEDNYAFCPTCGAAVSKADSATQISVQPSPAKAGDFGNILIHGDGMGNAAITVEIVSPVIFQIGLSIFLIWNFDDWWRVLGIVFLIFEIIRIVNTYKATKATEIIVYDYGVKGVSLEKPNFLIMLFWSLFETTEFQLAYDQISSVSKEKGKIVVIENKSGVEYRCPAQNASIIWDTVSKRINAPDNTNQRINGTISPTVPITIDDSNVETKKCDDCDNMVKLDVKQCPNCGSRDFSQI